MNKLWTEFEINFLRENYPVKGGQFCADKLNRTLTSVMGKSKREGLKVINRSKPTLLTHKEYESKLLEKELDFIPLEKYINSNTPILHECIEGHQWKVVPRSILSGQGCPRCNGGIALTHEEYTSRINFKVLEPYINSHTLITHQCDKGHSWKASPNNILRGRGCPYCSKHGFKLDIPAILYYIKIGEYYKVGVTNRTVKQRFEEDSASKTIIILDQKHFGKGSEALEAEQKILETYKEHRVNVKNYLNSKGNTELFSINILPFGFLD